LLLVDLLTYFICIFVGLALWSALGVSIVGSPPSMFLLAIFGLVSVFASMGLYSGFGMHPIYEFRQCIFGTCLAFAVIVGATIRSSEWMDVLLSFPLMFVAVPIMRSLVRHFLAESKWWGVNCVVYSCDRRVNALYKTHLKNSISGLRPVGFIQEKLPSNFDSELSDQYLGAIAQSGAKVRERNAYIALVHRRGRPDHEIADYVNENLSGFSKVIISPDDERLPSLWAMGQNGGIVIEDKLLQPGSQITKRICDVAISGAVLFFGMPLFLFIALWVKLTSPGPLFFGHERIGRNGRKFKAWKFRSMCVDADKVLKQTLEENPELRAEWEATQKLKNDPRVSSSGKFLRKTSLDELPQLWNVLRGEMSLVGPRPIVASEVEKYDDKFQTYLRVTPGVTGFWQVSGRNLTTYDKRVELDDYYVRNWSLWFDFYILGRTIKTVLLREGAF